MLLWRARQTEVKAGNEMCRCDDRTAVGGKDLCCGPLESAEIAVKYRDDARLRLSHQ
jgi:hypothetical protein